MNIGLFAGSWGYECLNAMLNEGVKPKFVVTNYKYTSIIDVCKEKKIPVLHDLYDVTFYNIDIILSVGFEKIIKKDILSVPKYGIINAHPALLPNYRGRYPTLHAILNGEKEHGITFHYMDEGIDTGDIILQKRFSIEPNDTGKSLFNKTWGMIVSEFGILAKDISLGIIPKRVPQTKNGTYFKKELPNNGFIDMSWSSEKIDRFVRAFYFPPHEPAKVKINGKIFGIVPL